MNIAPDATYKILTIIASVSIFHLHKFQDLADFFTGMSKKADFSIKTSIFSHCCVVISHDDLSSLHELYNRHSLFYKGLIGNILGEDSKIFAISW
jgi:hypothetical protein